MLDRTQSPAYQVLSSIRIPKAQTHSLRNGLPLHVINVGEQPLARLECIFQAGTWYEPKRAVSYFTTRMMNEGTSTRTSRQISEYVDQYGAFIEFNHGVDKVTVTVYTLVKYLPEILVLLSDILQDSVFPAHELGNLQRITAQNLRVNLEKNAYVANAVFRENLFGENHPYGRTTREEDISLVTPEDVRGYYEQRLRGRPFDIVLAGKITERETALVDRYLGESDVSAAEPFKSVLPVNPARSAPVMIEKPNSVQSTIRTGRRLFTRQHPDYPSVSVLNEVLGGYFGSRLMKNIREDKGFTYGISSNTVAFLREGYWMIGTDVKKESTRETIEEIGKEIARLKEIPVGEDELETVKNYLIGSFAGSLNTAFDIADRFKITHFEGLPSDHYDQYVERVQAVTAADLLELANRYLDWEQFLKVVVGGMGAEKE